MRAGAPRRENKREEIVRAHLGSYYARIATSASALTPHVILACGFLRMARVMQIALRMPARTRRVSVLAGTARRALIGIGTAALGNLPWVTGTGASVHADLDPRTNPKE